MVIAEAAAIKTDELDTLALATVIERSEVGMTVATMADSKVANNVDEAASWARDVGVGSNPVMETINRRRRPKSSCLKVAYVIVSTEGKLTVFRGVGPCDVQSRGFAT